MKKLLSLFLTCILMLGGIITMPSCSKNNSTTENDTTFIESSDTTNNDVNEGTSMSAPNEIIKNNVAQYSIVYPEDGPYEIREAAVALATAIQMVTGVTIECKMDTEVYENSTNHILIGYTIFSESDEATYVLSGNEDAFLIKKMRSHLVFTGYFDNATIAATTFFVNSLLKKNYDAETKTLKVEEHIEEGKKEPPQDFHFKDLSKYTIVYDPTSPDYQRAALQFRNNLTLATGVELKTATDMEKLSSPYEILIGETNRALSHQSYDAYPRLMEYKRVVSKGQLQFVCGGAYSGRLCGEDLIEVMHNEPDGSLEEKEYDYVDLTTDVRNHTEGTDIRIMSANVLVEYGRKEYPSIERAEILAKILVDYTPDLIGAQEMTSNYHQPMQRYFEIIKEHYGIEYSMILHDFNGSFVHSPILYRSDKFRVDYQRFTPPLYQPNPINGQFESGISCAKFTSIEDPTFEIVLLSSHWHWEKEEVVVGTPKQSDEALEMTRIVLEMREQYPNAHVFCTGDFNSHRFNRQYFNQFVTAINGEIASDIARKNGVLEPSFLHQGQLIDHIISKKGTFDVLLHAPTKNHTEVLTDHEPIFADIKFK